MALLQDLEHHSTALLAVSLFGFLGRWVDIALLLTCSIYRNRHLGQFILDYGIIGNFLQLAAALTTCFHAWRWYKAFTTKESAPENFGAQPLIFPCRASHTRLVPKVHGFSYSYLLTGIPVGWKGSVGGMLGADLPQPSKSWYSTLWSFRPAEAWFTVTGDDYLLRGNGTLQEKLDGYLQSQNIDPKKYAYAYLLTAPRLLGYVFNPVSIWNLYNSAKDLKALILEVNNTSDERRIYFMEPQIGESKSANLNIPPKLSHAWQKDFYVSVFNGQFGTYHLSAIDPLYPSMSGPGNVNVNITLKAENTSLVGRVFSDGLPFDPASTNFWSKSKFIAVWSWVGFCTFAPRTLFEAWKLFTKRGLAWVPKPEPRRETIPRHADATEEFFEPLFREFLRDLVKLSKTALSISYSPAGTINTVNELMHSIVPKSELEKLHTVNFNVLTPAFYSNFTKYPTESPFATFLSEIKNATIEVSPVEALANLGVDSLRASLNSVYNPRFWLFERLRNGHLNQNSTDCDTITTKGRSTKTNLDANSLIPKLSLSPFESYLFENHSTKVQSEYVKRALKMIICDYIAFGFTEILDFEMFILRSVVAWVVAGMINV